MDYVSNVVGELKIDDINLRLAYMELIELTPEDFKASHKLRNALRNKEIIVYDPQLHRAAKRNPIRNTQNSVKFSEIKVERKSVEHPNFSEISELKEALNSIATKMENLVQRVDSILLKTEHCAICLEKNLEATKQMYETKITNLNNALEKNLENNQRNFESSRQSYDSKIDKLSNIVESSQKNLELNRQNYDAKIEKLTQILEKTIEHNLFLEEKFKDYLEKETKVKESYQNPALDILISKLDTLISSGIKVQGTGNFNSSKTEFSTRVKEDIPIFVPDISSEDMTVNVVTKEETSEGTESILEKLKNLKK